MNSFIFNVLQKAGAFAPANISCIFRIVKHEDPRWAGSCGFGFTLNTGVTISVSKSAKGEVFFNGTAIDFPTVRTVVRALTKESIAVDIRTPLPLGCGFGLSGASALATAYSVNTLLSLGKTKKELAILAHTAEVENKTGMGDVINQYFGGLCVKFVPSSHFIIKKVPFNNIPVYTAHFGAISTRSILQDEKGMDRINTSASDILDKMKKRITSGTIISFEEIIDLAHEFAVGSALLTDKKTIDTIRTIKKKHGHASMIMLGNAVFSNVDFNGATKHYISDQGAYVLTTAPIFYFYILRCSDNSLYCGTTSDLDKRLKEHNGYGTRGAKYLRSRKPVAIVYSEPYADIKSALRREYEVKQWPKEKKEALVKR